MTVQDNVQNVQGQQDRKKKTCTTSDNDPSIQLDER